MEIKVGRKYLDRYGHVWVVTKHDPGFCYPFIARDPLAMRDESFTPDGRWSNYCEFACDLVKET